MWQAENICCLRPAARSLALWLISRVRLVRGNLIALKQLEKMIQNIDSKHLITV